MMNKRRTARRRTARRRTARRRTARRRTARRTNTRRKMRGGASVNSPLLRLQKENILTILDMHGYGYLIRGVYGGEQNYYSVVNKKMLYAYLTGCRDKESVPLSESGGRKIDNNKIEAINFAIEILSCNTLKEIEDVVERSSAHLRRTGRGAIH